MALYKMTQVDLAREVAERVPDATVSDAKRFLAALEDVVHDNLAKCIRTEVAGMVIEPKLRASAPKREGRNPATGEAIMLAARPASVRVVGRAAKKLKEKAPSVKKLQAAL